eukprot:GEMP01004555.1.p1 GENE.GEMP01004555.1~~GEMP01004555.1.p1  ORF type:complete len:1087 (+),score=315.08 GEMP01004555.1:113-3373(+)
MRRFFRTQRFRKTFPSSSRNLPSRRTVSSRSDDPHDAPRDANGHPRYRFMVDGEHSARSGFVDTKWYGEQLSKMVEHSQHLVKRRQLNERAIRVVIAISLAGGALIFWNWKSVKSDLAKESADLVKETIESPELQTTASLFSKDLLQSLLTDENIRNTVSVWVMDLLRSLQTEIGALVVRILQQEQVLGQVRVLGDDLVAHLAQSAEIQKLVSHLLLQAIWLPTAQESIAKWVASPTIISGLKDLIVRTLDTEEVQDQVAEKVRVLGDDLVAHLSHSETIQQQVAHLLLQAIWLPSAQESVANWVVSPTIVNSTQELVKNVLASEEVRMNASEMLTILLKELLSNEAIKIQLSDTLRTALSDSSVLEAARDAAWSIVNPFWSHQKKLPAVDMVKLLRSLPLSESEKLAVADLALHAALPATLLALADADLSADPDHPYTLLTATLRHVPPHDLIRGLVANNQLAVLPSGDKQSLLEHMLEIVPAHVAQQQIGKVASGHDGAHAESDGTMSDKAFLKTWPTTECIRRLGIAVEEGELSDLDTDMLARLACRADPIHTIKRLQTCVLQLKDKNALAVGALQSAPVETLEHLMIAPLLDEERVLLARAAVHVALGETLDSVAEVDDDQMQARLAYVAMRVAREETLRVLEAEEREFNEREKQLLVDLVVRVAPDAVALKRPRLQAPWEVPAEGTRANDGEAAGAVSSSEREVRKLEKRLEVRERKRLLSRLQDEEHMWPRDEKNVAPVFGAEDALVDAWDKRLQQRMISQQLDEDEKRNAEDLRDDLKGHPRLSSGGVVRGNFTTGGSSSSSSIITGIIPRGADECGEATRTGNASAPCSPEEVRTERVAETDFLTDMRSRAKLRHAEMPSLSQAFLGSYAAFRVAFAKAAGHFRRQETDGRGAEVALEEADASQDPEVALEEGSEDSRYPELAQEGSEDSRYPEVALEETDDRRYPQVAEEDSEESRDPEVLQRETDDRRYPQVAQRDAEDKRDPEAGRRDSEDRRDPRVAQEANKNTRCPEVTPGDTLERRDSDMAEGDSADKRDPEVGHGSDVAGEDLKDKCDPVGSPERRGDEEISQCGTGEFGG